MSTATLLDYTQTETRKPEILANLAEALNEPTSTDVAPRHKQKWIKIAKSKIAKAYEIKSPMDRAIVRNKLINQAYAEMYLSDPDNLKWAGLAIFASHSIGKKLELLRSISNVSVTSLIVSFGTALPLWYLKSELEYLYEKVALGNLRIYADIYWQHLAYQAGGIAELELCYQQGDLPEKVLQAWKMLDEGRKTGQQDLIWLANIDLLEHEQKDVIQPILYDGQRNIDLWELITATHGVFGTLIASPVPEVTKSFRDALPYGNLANYEQRWKWCTENIMTDWKAYEPENQKKVELLIRKITA